MLTPNPIHEYWQSHDDMARHGGAVICAITFGANAYARDARPLDLRPRNHPGKRRQPVAMTA